MKKLLTVTALSFTLSFTATAQLATNPPAPPTGMAGLGQTVLDYFTVFNTNLDSTFGDNRFCLWTGASSVQNSPSGSLMNDLGASYDLWRPTPSTNSTTKTAISLELDTRNGGVAGSLVSAQAGAGFSVIIHDVRATLYLDGGAYLDKTVNRNSFFGEVGVRVFKAFGAHFFGGVGMGAQFPDNRQVFSAFAGATF